MEEVLKQGRKGGLEERLDAKSNAPEEKDLRAAANDEVNIIAPDYLEEKVSENIETAVVKHTPSFGEVIVTNLVDMVAYFSSKITEYFKELYTEALKHTIRSNKKYDKLSEVILEREGDEQYAIVYKKVIDLYNKVKGYKFKILEDVAKAQLEVKFHYPDDEDMKKLIERKNSEVTNSFFLYFSYEIGSNNVKNFVKTDYVEILEKGRKLGLTTPSSEQKILNEMLNFMSGRVCKYDDSYHCVTVILDFAEKCSLEDELVNDLSFKLVDNIIKSISYNLEFSECKDEIEESKQGISYGIGLAEKIGYTEAVEKFEALR